jgi:hypothetical protein
MAPIIPREDYILRLRSLPEPIDVLQTHGFVLRQLTDEELLKKRRCSKCNEGDAGFSVSAHV